MKELAMPGELNMRGSTIYVIHDYLVFVCFIIVNTPMMYYY